MKTLLSAVALTLAVLGAGSAAAQDVAPGTRVRISDPRMDRPAVGVLVALTPDSAFIHGGERSEPVGIGLQGARIERSRGRSGHAIEGALILGLAGGAYGWLAKSLTDDVLDGFGAQEEGISGAFVFILAGAGAAAGALIGALIRTEGWDQITIRPAAATGGGVGVGITVPTR